MRYYLEERIIEEGRYIAETGATVRKTASVFHLGKSTVHKDVSLLLKNVDFELYLRVKKVLMQNLAERHIRGGIATKNKYLKDRKR